MFQVGDAADAWPPTGGLGANTGIQDAHNLAWKLAGVVKGTAGAGLLDTYDQERRPIGLLIMGQVLARFATRMAPGQGPEVLDDGAVSLGYQYRSSAVAGATDPDPRPLPPVALTGQPGSRAPHLPVTVDHRQISTLDLYGRGFVLLAGVDGAGVDDGRGQPPGAGSRLPLRRGAHPRRRGGRPRDRVRGALLVRPDGLVAWRSIGRPPDPPPSSGASSAPF